MSYPVVGLLAGIALIHPSQLLAAEPASPAPLSSSERNLFSLPSPDLDPTRQLDFKVGRGLFRRLWVTPPASTQASDGLGPLYSARSCMSCHPRNGRGQPPAENADNAISMVLRVDIPPQGAEQRALLASGRVNNIPEPNYGLQLQEFAVSGHDAEYRLAITHRAVPVSLADGSVVELSQPGYEVADPGFGTLHPQARLSPRVAPQMIGLGLLEAIDEQDILRQADPDDRDGDGISGRPNRVWDLGSGSLRLGRFGHKAGMPTLEQQVQHAFALDLGLSVPLYPVAYGDCTARQTACRDAPNGNSPQYDNLEAHQLVTDLVTLYASHLAVPQRRDTGDPEVKAGQKLFEDLGCDSCHTPRYRTGSHGPAKANHARDIAPYTDLLLHDMGEGLADHRPEGRANGREWRTAPLWGIGLTAVVSGHNRYLHDGRARNLLEAILWHGGEAQSQRDAVVALDARSRRQLLKFIESL